MVQRLPFSPQHSMSKTRRTNVCVIKGCLVAVLALPPEREGTSSLVINLVPGLWARVPEFYAVGLRSSSHLNDSDTALAE